VKLLTGLSEIRKAKAIGIAALLSMLLTGWLFVLSPRNDAVSAVNDLTTAAAAANDSLRTQIETRRAQQAELPELRTLAAALAIRFPPNAQQPRLFRMVTAAAGRAGLAPGAITNVTTGAPVPDATAGPAQIAVQQITLNVTGTAVQLRRLIGNLEQLPRAFQITAVSLASTATHPAGAPSSKHAITITGQMFVMSALTDPTTPITQARHNLTRTSRSSR
jgi:Tfp pilus assembly protein PilO